MINQQSGSVQDIWRQMDYTVRLSVDEIEYLKRASMPYMELKKIEVKDGIIQLDSILQPHEICLIDISYQYEKQS